MIFQVEDTIIVDKKVLVNQTLFKKFRHMTLKVQNKKQIHKINIQYIIKML